MAAVVEFPPSNTVLAGSHPLQTAPLPVTQFNNAPHVPDSAAACREICSTWISSFNHLLSVNGVEATALFLKEAYWRDLLCMSWDFRTLQGPLQIAEFVASASQDCRICHVSLDHSAAYKDPQATDLGGATAIQAFLRIETRSGRGRGLVRLVPTSDDGGSWKAFTLLTSLEELKGHEESTHTRRPTGHEAEKEKMNWKDQVKAEHNYDGAREPQVLIVGKCRYSTSFQHVDTCSLTRSGAGQGGLAAAARLKQLHVDTVIIDKNSCIGDNWRNRYHQLVLHDSVW